MSLIVLRNRGPKKNPKKRRTTALQQSPAPQLAEAAAAMEYDDEAQNGNVIEVYMPTYIMKPSEDEK